MQSPTGWLLWRLGKGLKNPPTHTYTHMFELFSNEMPSRWGNSSSLPLLSLPGSTAKLHFITRSIDFTRNPWTESGGQIALAFIKWRVYVYIYKQMNIYFWLWVCASVAHVAEPQGVGELLASNWNCRFNILNYRLANGQYFVTTLQCHTLFSLPSTAPPGAATDRYMHTSNCAT